MVLSHAVCEDIVGRVIISEQLRTLNAQFHLANDNGFVVVLIVVVAARRIVHQQLFA